MKILTLIIIITFVLGIYYYANSGIVKEGLENNDCPNMLIEKDGEIFLLNSKAKIVTDKNPIKFKNLDEYIEFVEMQSAKNIHCPVLYLQYTTDTQNNNLLVIKPSILVNDGGLMPLKIAKPEINDIPNPSQGHKQIVDPDIKYNNGNYSAFDPDNQDIGIETPLDKMYVNVGISSSSSLEENQIKKGQVTIAS